MNQLEQAIAANAVETMAGDTSPSGQVPPRYLLGEGYGCRFIPVTGLDLWVWQWIDTTRRTRVIIQGVQGFRRLLSEAQAPPRATSRRV